MERYCTETGHSSTPSPQPILPPANIIEEAEAENEQDEPPPTAPLLPQVGSTRNDPVDNKNHVVDLKQEKDEETVSENEYNQSRARRSCCSKRTSMIFTNIGIFVLINTVTGLLMYFFGRNKTIGGVTVFNWALLGDVLVCGLIIVMVVIKGINFFAGKISRRIRYYTAPFVRATYTAVWAFVSLVLMPVFLTDEEYDSRTAHLLRNFLNIVASCSLVAVGGNILVLIMERVVFGDMQGNLNESLRNERLVALIAMKNVKDNRRVWKVLRTDESYNVLSLANLIRSGNYGLSYWLKIEAAPNERITVHKTAHTTADMIMEQSADPNFLHVRDIVDTPHIKPKDAYRIFNLLDYNNKGKATKDEIRVAVANIIHERKTVVDLLKSRRLIVDILAQIIYGVVFVICGVITLVVFIGMDVYTLLVALGTTFIGLGFALSTTLTGLLESLQMLFFVRPFEIGDIVRINDGPTMQVERVTIISTFFYSMDGYGVHFPNAKLARAKISNYRRSKDVSLDIPVHLKLGTTAEQLGVVRTEIQEYIEQHPHWNPRFFFGVLETKSKYVIAMLMVSLKSSWQEKLIWNKYAADLRIFLIWRLVQLGIHYEQLENVIVAPSMHRNSRINSMLSNTSNNSNNNNDNNNHNNNLGNDNNNHNNSLQQSKFHSFNADYHPNNNRKSHHALDNNHSNDFHNNDHGFEDYNNSHNNRNYNHNYNHHSNIAYSNINNNYHMSLTESPHDNNNHQHNNNGHNQHNNNQFNNHFNSNPFHNTQQHNNQYNNNQRNNYLNMQGNYKMRPIPDETAPSPHHEAAPPRHREVSPPHNGASHHDPSPPHHGGHHTGAAGGHGSGAPPPQLKRRMSLTNIFSGFFDSTTPRSERRGSYYDLNTLRKYENKELE